MSFGQNYLKSQQVGFNILTIHLQTFIAKIITVYIFIFVFEETIYGRLALGPTSYLVAKTATEVFLYFFLSLIVANKLIHGQIKQYKFTYFDFCIVTFLCFAFISVLINDGSLIQGAVNVRTMLRYIAIYYIIVISRWIPTEQQTTTFIKLLVGLALLQSLLIIFQHFAGDAFRDAYFSPPNIELSISGINNVINLMESKLGAGYGTFGKTPLAAFYLLLTSIIAVVMALSSKSQKAKIWWLAYALILVGIYFSYKRAPLLFALSTPIFASWFLGRKRLALYFIIFALVVIPITSLFLSNIKLDGYINEKKTEISPTESIAQLLTEEYWTVSSNKARGWVLIEVTQKVLVPFRPFGYGADEEHAKTKLSLSGGEFSKLAGWESFDDVYIVAGLVYFGPFGIFLLITAFFFLYQHGKILTNYYSVKYLNNIGVILVTSIILIFFSVFVVRILEFRSFAFPFWVIAGIAVSTVINKSKDFTKLTSH